VFVTGMFRTGTTLLGRLLNSHREISIATDPYKAFFKTFRNEIAQINNIDVKPDSPFNDYYFSINQLRLLEKIQLSTFDIPFKITSIHNLRKNIEESGSDYSPLIMPHLDIITGDSYKKLFISMISLVAKCYSKKSDKIIGFKEVWTDEFILPLARTFTNFRFIQIIRDPRAVLASKKMQTSQYPWLFLARQWRKLSALAWIYQQKDCQFRDRILLVKYEDLINKPEQTVKKICNHLEIYFDPKMIDPSTFVDGKGNRWLQNTSFGIGKNEFDTNSINRWKSTLTDHEKDYIEALCGAEMKLHGYDLKNDLDEIDPKILYFPPRVSDHNLANWIRKFVKNDIVSTSLQSAIEQIRYDLLNIKNDESIDRRLIESCFLFFSLYRHLKVSIQNE
jgi:hypothetical protein